MLIGQSPKLVTDVAMPIMLLPGQLTLRMTEYGDLERLLYFIIRNAQLAKRE
jgi:hypothetical protein